MISKELYRDHDTYKSLPEMLRVHIVQWIRKDEYKLKIISPDEKRSGRCSARDHHPPHAARREDNFTFKPYDNDGQAPARSNRSILREAARRAQDQSAAPTAAQRQQPALDTMRFVDIAYKEGGETKGGVVEDQRRRPKFMARLKCKKSSVNDPYKMCLNGSITVSFLRKVVAMMNQRLDERDSCTAQRPSRSLQASAQLRKPTSCATSARKSLTQAMTGGTQAPPSNGLMKCRLVFTSQGGTPDPMSSCRRERGKRGQRRPPSP
eukprot:6204612-Pleurochrysis_carterae.AAC.2